MAVCPICLVEAELFTTGDFGRFGCPSCGDYRISGTAIKLVENKVATERLDRSKLSVLVRQFSAQTSPEIAAIDSTAITGLLAAASG